MNFPPKSAWLKGALIVLLTVLAYLPALRGGFIWDDDDYIIKNKSLREPGGLQHIWTDVRATPQYYPLVHTAFRMEYQMWGLRPVGYHVINILLHTLAALLLWRLLLRLQLPGAWLAALLFALHPVAVESVAWITERKNVLSAVFYFAAALAYLRFTPVNESVVIATKSSRRNPASAQSPSYNWRWYGVALVLFVCALLSKSVTCSFPAAMLLVFWWKRGRLGWRDVLPLVPFFLVGLGLALNTAHLEKVRVGAVGPEWEIPFLERVLIAGRALWFYAGKLFWPADLTFIYPRWTISAAVWWQWLFPAGAALVVGGLWFLRDKIGRGPLVAVLFFAGTLFPALGFFNVYPMRYSFVADHFQYLASVGLLVAAAVVLTRVAARAIYVLPLALGVLTWQQTQVYHDLETLWRDTIQKNPGCWLAYANLSNLRQAAGDPVEADALCRTALRLKPDSEVALNDLGASLVKQGHLDEGITYLERGLAVNPNGVALLVNYGLFLQRKGQIDKAMEYYQRALAIDPADAQALMNMGTALTTQNRRAEAKMAFEAAIDSRPDLLLPKIKLGYLLKETGDNAAAERLFREVIRTDLDNPDAHAGLAEVLEARGNTKEALAEYELLARNYPSGPVLNQADIHLHIGTLFARLGDLNNAMAHWREALRLKPDGQLPMNNLAWIMATARDATYRNGAEAVRLAERAVQVTTNASPETWDTLAAAYAENKQWSNAVQTAQKAMALASTNQALSAEILRRLELYRTNQPWRE
jgi:tetratricopeptide (TPR) repeat protein